MRALFITFIIFGGIAISHQKTKDEWKSRTIYQVLTDRYLFIIYVPDSRKEMVPKVPVVILIIIVAETIKDSSKTLITLLVQSKYYSIGMGFDAIWISPVVDNYDGGYHGYWTRNIYEINSKLGSKEDLKALVNTAHQKGIWVMIDLVANHMGNGN